MAKKQTSEGTVADRVLQLLADVWGNNQRRMAEEIGCSQAAISNIVTGKFLPGKRLLSLIAAHRDVNEEWLMQGKGSPRRQQVKSPELPISQQPLPGPPDQYPQMLTGETYRIPHEDYSPKRYWLELLPTDPAVAHRSQKMSEGDLILIDTDPIRLSDAVRLGFFVGIAWVEPFQEDRMLEVGQIRIDTYDDGSDRPILYSFRRGYKPDDVYEEFSFKVFKNRETQIERSTKFERDSKQSGESGSRRLSYNQQRKLEFVVELTDIVGICLSLLRRTID